MLFRHLLTILLVVYIVLPATGGFVHPGLLHGSEDLVRIKAMVGQNIEPYKSGFMVLASDRASQSDYRLRGPSPEIGRKPNIMFMEFDSDATAAYQLSLMWAITGDKACADKAIAIIDAWSAALKCVSGSDAVLMAGLGPFKMINAAEILRYTDSGWPDDKVRQCQKMFLDVIYPVVKDFALFANGNWDIAATQMVMSIGVFCDRQDIFERGLRYYVAGSGNGSLAHYIINESGQCQESGRDQPHTQLGLGLQSACCEVAWQQGLDLYGYANNRLLHGFEYTARYNLGEDVPFTETVDRTGKYHHKTVSEHGRGQLRAVYEMVYNHYVNRVGNAAPYSQKAAEKVRPEGSGNGGDHPGFGTVLYTRSPAVPQAAIVVPAAPGGLVASGVAGVVELSWISVIGSTGYIVKRADDPEGKYITIAENILLPSYKDETVKSGQVYYYTVSAVNTVGSGPDSYFAGICAGLPQGWQRKAIGEDVVNGSTSFDGQVFTLIVDSENHVSELPLQGYTCKAMRGDVVITARYVPQISCQASTLGLLISSLVDRHGGQAAFILTPKFDRGMEVPGWYASLITQVVGKDPLTVSISQVPDVPYLSYNRLTGYIWLRLERHGAEFIAYISSDGLVWNQVGKADIALGQDISVGLAAGVGMKNMTTTVQFDNVEVNEVSK